MNRYVYMGLRNWYCIPFWAIEIAKRNKWDKHYSFEENYQMIRKMVQRIIRTGNVEVQVLGLENLPKNTGYAMYVNHQGFFDGMALIYALEQPFHFLMMKEMEKFPFVHFVLNLMKPIYMDRSDLRQSAGAISECVNLCKNGERIAIFPEGTLEKEENTPLPYKPGALKTSYQSKTPIVQVILRNSFLPFEHSGCRKCTVSIIIQKPDDYTHYQNYRTSEVAKQLQNRCKELLI